MMEIVSVIYSIACPKHMLCEHSMGVTPTTHVPHEGVGPHAHHGEHGALSDTLTPAHLCGMTYEQRGALFNYDL